MLDFVNVLNAKDDILSGSENPSRANLKIVGQESNGCLVVVWCDVNPKFQHKEELVTHISLYDPTSGKNKVVFVHNQHVDVVNCTVNEEKTFIGFVTVEKCEKTGGHGKKFLQDVYKAYIAEIRPQNRVFDLNLDRENYLKLQFLWGAYSNNPATHEPHMLVFLHKESIGMYHLPVKKIGENQFIMSGEPRKEQIFHRKFVWSQFDRTLQRLYVAHFRKHGRDERGQIIQKSFVTCFQFTQRAVLEFLLEVVVDFPFPATRTSSIYIDLGPSDVIPVSAINLSVMTQENGTCCFCYQYPLAVVKPSVNGDVTTLEYSVTMIHHGKVLRCSCDQIPRQVAESARLFFSWAGDYLLVYLHGYFIHLLNVGAEFEPAHHILWQDSCPDTGRNKTQVYVQFLKPTLSTSSPTDVYVYDCQDQRAFMMCVKQEAVIDDFQFGDVGRKISALHFAINHSKNIALIKKLFEVLCSNTASPEVVLVFKEFLVASAFSSARGHSDLAVLNLLPFTCFEPYRCHTETTYGRQRLFSVSYSNMGLLTLAAHETRMSSNFLNRMLTCNKQAHCRFSHSTVRKHLELEASLKKSSAEPSRINKKEKSVSCDQGESQEGAALKQGEFSSLSNLKDTLGEPPEFLFTSSTGDTQHEECLISQKTLKLLVHHLTGCLKKESRFKLQTFAERYVRSKLSEVYLLCHLLWSVLGTEVDKDPKISLNVRGSWRERQLLIAFESCMLAVRQLAFPLPEEFSLYFTSLAFRCVNLRQFLQYVKAGVIPITLKFALQMLKDLDDSDINIEAKLQVLTLLQCKDAVQCLKIWHHPISEKYLAFHYTAVCLTDDSSDSWDFFPSAQSVARNTVGFSRKYAKESVMGVSCPPLTTFIRLLEKRDPGLAGGESLGQLHFDSSFIEEAALSTMISQTSLKAM